MLKGLYKAILGLYRGFYRDNGKENGNYYRDYVSQNPKPSQHKATAAKQQQAPHNAPCEKTELGRSGHPADVCAAGSYGFRVRVGV